MPLDDTGFLSPKVETTTTPEPWLRRFFGSWYGRLFATPEPAAPAAPEVVDARLTVLRAAYDICKKRNVVHFIRSSPGSPAARSGALEAIHHVTRHPVHVLETRMMTTRQYSCDTSCMTT